MVIDNKDYTIFRSILERMEKIIELGELDQVAWDHIVGKIEDKENKLPIKKG